MITDSHAIQAFLARLATDRVALTVFLPDIKEAHSSLVLSVESEQAALVIDELRPESGHKRVAPGVVLRIIGRLDGVEIRFRATVRSIDIADSIAAYLLDLPEEMDYRERRQSYRVRVWPGLKLEAKLTTAEGASLTANVFDISQNGFGMLLPCSQPVALATVWQCTLQLPGGEVTMNITVRHVQPRDRGGGRDIRVGASYLDIDSNQQRRISHFATELQRRMLREHRLSP